MNEQGTGQFMGEFTAKGQPYLMTGYDYRRSLRDGRRVINGAGEYVEDVATDPAFAGGVDLFAQFYDAQHEEATRDILTYHDDEIGARVSRAWQVPRNKEDLIQRRRMTKFSTNLTMGVFGRPPDYGPLSPMGYLTMASELSQFDSAGLDNLRSFMRWGRANNLTSADVIADVQSDRRVPPAEKAGRLRVVGENSSGKILYGAKPCMSAAIQGHVGTIVTALSPGGDPNAAIYGWVPFNLEGMTFVSREKVSSDGGEHDHPLDARGEESDSLVVFDNVLVPHENFFSFGREEMLSIYYRIGNLSLWHILSRLAYKAEIFAGTGELITQVLGTNSIPQVRDHVSELMSYATTLKAFVLAAEDTSEVRDGVCVPNEDFVTAGRLHSIVEYPKMLQILRELSGQGLISRFTESAMNHPDIEEMMAEFLPGTGVSAGGKNRLFNYVWDLACGGNALRVGLFENVNSTPPAALRAAIYRSPRRQEMGDTIADFLGLHIQK